MCANSADRRIRGIRQPTVVRRPVAAMVPVSSGTSRGHHCTRCIGLGIRVGRRSLQGAERSAGRGRGSHTHSVLFIPVRRCQPRCSCPSQSDIVIKERLRHNAGSVTKRCETIDRVAIELGNMPNSTKIFASQFHPTTPGNIGGDRVVCATICVFIDFFGFGWPTFPACDFAMVPQP